MDCQSSRSTAIGTYLVVALFRLAHPFDLEWLEGGAVEHVRRVLSGRPIYTAPSVGFVAYTYPPLYFWVSATIARSSASATCQCGSSP